MQVLMQPVTTKRAATLENTNKYEPTQSGFKKLLKDFGSAEATTSKELSVKLSTRLKQLGLTGEEAIKFLKQLKDPLSKLDHLPTDWVQWLKETDMKELTAKLNSLLTKATETEETESLIVAIAILSLFQQDIRQTTNRQPGLHNQTNSSGYVQPGIPFIKEMSQLFKQVKTLLEEAKQQHSKSNTSFNGLLSLKQLSNELEVKNPTVMHKGLSNFSIGHLSTVEQLIIHVPKETLDTTSFTRQLASVLQKGKMMTLPNGSTQLNIKLFPEHLGQLNVQITQINGEVTAKIITSSIASKELIDSQIHQLKQALLGQNIQIEKLEVSQNFTMQHQSSQKEEADQNQSRGQNQEQSEQSEEPEQHFDEWLDALFENEQMVGE